MMPLSVIHINAERWGLEGCFEPCSIILLPRWFSDSYIKRYIEPLLYRPPEPTYNQRILMTKDEGKLTGEAKILASLLMYEPTSQFPIIVDGGHTSF